MMFIGNIGSLMPLLMAIVTFGSVAFGWYKGNQTANDEAFEPRCIDKHRGRGKRALVSSATVEASTTIHFFDTEPNDYNQPTIAKHEVVVHRQHQPHNPTLKTPTPFLYRYMGLSPPAKSIA
jgi:hypothetical protein